MENNGSFFHYLSIIGYMGWSHGDFQLIETHFFLKVFMHYNELQRNNDLLSRKTEEKLKQSRNTKILSTTAAPVNIISSSLFSTPPMTTAPQTRTSSDPDIALKSIAEHRRYFFNLLKIWCSNHKDDFMSDSFDLKEGEDFILNVLYDQNNNLKVSVKCNYTLSSSTSMTLKPSPPIQQPASLAPVSVSTGALSSMAIPSANTQTPALKTNSRKRGHSSSQVASSQKTKRNRSQTYASLLFQD
ncbi:unnamed protein product [Rotaria sordida]|uniref:Uncharacterized protein n=1 Tax=Rotaria sordida TaxID=392033 RepID=A0A819TJ16_9BILA|nr:unnamed protein product [Rotaria sordida]CAF4088520.1 unnamed protein product [Rotaria sordida]